MGSLHSLQIVGEAQTCDDCGPGTTRDLGLVKLLSARSGQQVTGVHLQQVKGASSGCALCYCAGESSVTALATQGRDPASPFLAGSEYGSGLRFLTKCAQAHFLSSTNKNNPAKSWEFLYLCRREESNLHPLRDTILSRARLPIPPLRQYFNSILYPIIPMSRVCLPL